MSNIVNFALPIDVVPFWFLIMYAVPSLVLTPNESLLSSMVVKTGSGNAWFKRRFYDQIITKLIKKFTASMKNCKLNFSDWPNVDISQTPEDLLPLLIGTRPGKLLVLTLSPTQACSSQKNFFTGDVTPMVLPIRSVGVAMGHGSE